MGYPKVVKRNAIGAMAKAAVEVINDLGWKPPKKEMSSIWAKV